MAKGRSRPNDRQTERSIESRPRRRRRVVKPAGWPRYMVAKALSNGDTGYYWNPPKAYRDAGFILPREALGTDYGAAINRAALLNKHLDAWRKGRDADRSIDIGPRVGTIDWLIARYMSADQPAWKRLSDRSKPEYRRILYEVADTTTKIGRFGGLPATSISPRAVDKLYVRLQSGKDGRQRQRTANLCIIRMARAWDVVSRHYPALVPAQNPFRGVELIHSKQTTRPASREEAFALHRALIAAGELHLAAVPLICFEWHQRPENVLSGHLTWADYKPPIEVRIEHHKTGERLWYPLSDQGMQFFPELCTFLDGLPRLGTPIVIRESTRGPARPYTHRRAREIVAKARRTAGLPGDLTLAACRHGGMTELGDAELTEQGVMALSGHKTPEAARLYVKKTQRQRLDAARKRRTHVEQYEDKIQNGATAGDSE